ncbi:hypothetical protein QZH41_016095 [Actinostola sp. cb2023]|nr:hypothetical protein QZH41_016095 [Actinostola sp. cb2023]
MNINYLLTKDEIKAPNVDNKLIIEEVAKTEELDISNENPTTEMKEDEFEDKIDEKPEDKNELSEESEEEEDKEKKDDEKESLDGALDCSTESLAESEIELRPESCKSETHSDSEGKDSGIEKGESPTLSVSKENTDEDGEPEPEPTATNAKIPDLRTSSFVGTTTLNVLSPAISKTKRFVKKSNSMRRSRNDVDLDSELSCDSSPEKRPRRKNLTVSYLSYPQRFVRSSLAVEARLSQWHKETSVLEGTGTYRVDTPSRNGILKQTAQNTMKNSVCQRNSTLKAPRRDVSFPDSRLSDSDASSDEDAMRMSVRKISSSKSALRKRIENLEGMLLSMATQKKGLEELIVTMETWSLELSHVERTKLGVPYIRSVKEILKKQRRCLTNKKAAFGKLASLLQEANVPCFNEVNNMIKQLYKDVSSIVQDRKRYSSRHIEDIRQTQGQIIGTCSAIKAVFYDE